MKRNQTTGQPKDRKKAQVEAAPAKSRHEREARIQRYIIIATVATVVLVAVILVAAVVLELFITPNQTVASVNGTTINVSQFESRVRLERALLNDQINGYLAQIQSLGMDPNQFAGQEPLRTWLSQVQIPDQLGNKVVEDMVGEALIRQQAQEMGVSVTEADIQKQIERFFDFNPETAGLPPTPTLTPTITPTPFVSPTPTSTPLPSATPTPLAEGTAEATAEASPTFTATPFATVEPTATLTADEQAAQYRTNRDEYFANLRRLARVGDAEINGFFEMRALRAALRGELFPEMTTQAPFVNARHILVATQEEAEDIMAALQAGESFAQLAQAASTDTGSGANGGELGWSSVYSFVGPFADAAANAPIGELIGPVETEFGWHIIQVRARENREITEDELDSARDRRFDTWLSDLRTAEGTQVEISSIWTDHVPEEPVFVPLQ